MITRENHEQHALDYLDGTLDPATREAFEAFMRLHPEEREALEGLEEMHLRPRRVPFEGKERLKHLDEDRLDYLVIAAAEGVLTDEECAFVEDACDREAFAASMTAYRRVSSDRSIRFPGKERLHRRAPVSFLWRALAGGIAAAVFLGVLFLWPRERGEDAAMTMLAQPLQLAAGTSIVVVAKPAPASPKPLTSPVSPTSPTSPPPRRPAASPIAALHESALPLAVMSEASLPGSPDRLVARALPSLPAPSQPPQWMLIAVRDNGIISSVATLFGMGREIAEDAGKRVALSLEMIKNSIPYVTY
jgi:hypothetical protein